MYKRLKSLIYYASCVNMMGSAYRKRVQLTAQLLAGINAVLTTECVYKMYFHNIMIKTQR